jgi:hypothetical protein
MRLKARLKRLEAKVKWLQLEGRLRSVELRLKILNRTRQIAEHHAARRAKAPPSAKSSPAEAPHPIHAPRRSVASFGLTPPAPTTFTPNP